MPQNSFAFWINVDSEFPEVHYKGFCTGGISAYLASELGEMIYKNQKLMVCPNWEERGVYRMQYDLQWWCEGKTLADVYAKMLIYLIENHLISVEELGK